jgi:hypothetical protein
MTDYMAFRGPNAQAVWHKDNIGFGHTLLQTTFEQEREQQPLTLDNLFLNYLSKPLATGYRQIELLISVEGWTLLALQQRRKKSLYALSKLLKLRFLRTK